MCCIHKTVSFIKALSNPLFQLRKMELSVCLRFKALICWFPIATHICSFLVAIIPWRKDITLRTPADVSCADLYLREHWGEAMTSICSPANSKRLSGTNCGMLRKQKTVTVKVCWRDTFFPGTWWMFRSQRGWDFKNWTGNSFPWYSVNAFTFSVINKAVTLKSPVFFPSQTLQLTEPEPELGWMRQAALLWGPISDSQQWRASCSTGQWLHFGEDHLLVLTKTNVHLLRKPKGNTINKIRVCITRVKLHLQLANLHVDRHSLKQKNFHSNRMKEESWQQASWT